VWRISILGKPLFPFDDAYITLHSAQVLWTGGDINYPGTPALAGVTSAVHMGLVAALMAVFRPEWALEVSIWIGIFAYVLGLLRLAFLHRASPAQALLVATLGTIIARTPHQLLNGLETGLAIAALVWALVLATEPDRRRQRYLPALCGLLPFLRPELLVASTGFLALTAYRHWELKLHREALRSIAVDCCIALALAAPFAIWYSTSLGHPYPLTMGAKKAFYAQSCFPPGARASLVLVSLNGFASVIGTFTFAGLLLFLTRAGWVGIATILALATAFFVNLPNGLLHTEHRYLHVLIPFLLYAAVPFPTGERLEDCCNLTHDARAVPVGESPGLALAGTYVGLSADADPTCRNGRLVQHEPS
jgi:hypothetical protein